jgi:hypothetical protein
MDKVHRTSGCMFYTAPSESFRLGSQEPAVSPGKIRNDIVYPTGNQTKKIQRLYCIYIYIYIWRIGKEINIQT